jgi:hypothetical protein
MPAEQPRPKPGRRTVVDQVRVDLICREWQGAQQYGRPLETFNGRDGLRDAYEEALDLAVYLKQVLMERDDAAL